MNVQTLVVQHALDLVIDGISGKNTNAAIKKFQKDNGLVDDGIVGQKTMAAMEALVKSKELKILDRKKFFEAIRLSIFGSLNQRHVDGMNKILDTIGHLSINEQAYMLATTYHETGHTMWPVVERGSRSYFDKYETGRLKRILGNTQKGDGYRYRGRGFVQITGRDNYTRCGAKIGVDLANDPDKALDLHVASILLLRGMTEGWYRAGHKNSTYISMFDADYIKARNIINGGLDRALKIAEVAMKFNIALRLGK